MHNYGVSTEVVRLVLALGIIVSTLVYERWRLTGGAAVVAGYLGLFIDRPLYIVTTVLLAVATYYLVQHVIARRMFLYGRRRLIIMVLTGLILQLFTSLIAYLTSQDIIWLTGLYGVGFVLPGLIAQDMERQGIAKTVLTALATALLTFVLFRGVLAIKAYLPIDWSGSSAEGQIALYSYHIQLLLPAVVMSVMVSALLYEWTGTRSGGFLTAAYAALFILQPLHLLFIFGVGLLVYLFVTHFLMQYTPIFGRTKFAMMVLTGLVLTWTLEVIMTQSGIQNIFIPAGFSVISSIIAALIANDGERQGVPKTLAGVTICTLVVFVAIKSIDLLVLS